METSCKCKNPVLLPKTRECGKCGLYINRLRYIILTERQNTK